MTRQVIKEYVIKFFSEKNWLEENSENLLSMILNYKKSLALGYVQSGKTKNILNLMEQSLATDFNIVLILGGTSKILLNQTDLRLIPFVNKINRIHYIGDNNYQYYFDKYKNLSELTEKGDKVILNVFKNYMMFNKVVENFEIIDTEKILIIDDESDFASLNIGQSSDEKSITYNNFSKLVKKNNVKLCMFTATPFANFISSKSDLTKPEIYYTLKNSDEYTGLEYFFQNNNCIKIDSELCSDEMKDKLILRNYELFLLSCGLYKTLELNNKKFEFLINLSNLTISQSDIKKRIYNIIKRIINEDKNDKYFDNVWNKHQQLFLKRKIIINNEQFQKIQNEFYKINEGFFSNFHQSVILLNSDNISNYKSENYKDIHTIIIGGNLISRGLTFERLLVELIISGEKGNKLSADTISQKARWCGYRKEYAKYISISMNKQLYSAYIEVINLNSKVFFPGQLKYVDNNLKNIIDGYNYEFIVPTSGIKRGKKNENGI